MSQNNRMIFKAAKRGEVLTLNFVHRDIFYPAKSKIFYEKGFYGKSISCTVITHIIDVTRIIDHQHFSS